MKKKAIINVRIDENKKKVFQETVETLGYDSSKAIASFIDYVVEKRSFPPKMRPNLGLPKRRESLTIPLIKQYLQETISHMEEGKKIKRAFLYGSYARGDQSPQSDVDVMLDLDTDASFNDLGEYIRLFSEALKKEVDITTTEYLNDPLFSETVLKERICIFERKD